jgi:transcriptional regulator with XRE-family HTH domain
MSDKVQFNSFGKRIRECREMKKMSQETLAGSLGTSYSVIGKYERDEMKPSIDVVIKIAKALDTSVGYLVDEVQANSILSDPIMLERLNDISSFNLQEQRDVLFSLDALIQYVKLKKIIR